MRKLTQSASMMNSTGFRFSVTILLLVAIVAGWTVAASASCYSIERTQTMKLAQKFGFDNDEWAYKIMVQSYATGNRFFVWYTDSLESIDGQDVVISFGTDEWWCKITNLKNGRESNIEKVLKVN